MSKKFISFIAPATLLQWGGILLYFYLSGRITSFLHPVFRPQVLIAGVVLTACGILLLLTRNRIALCECGPVEDCPDAGRSPLISSWLFPVILLLPLVVAAFFTTDQFGANIIATRGYAESASALPGLADRYEKKVKALAKAALPVLEPALPDENSPAAGPSMMDPAVADFFKPNAEGNIPVNVADLLYAAEEPTLRTPFEGQSAEIIGQYMPAKVGNPLGNRFKIVRLFMVCCASDAQPVSLLVERGADQELPGNVTEMVWTKVIGEVTFPIENGRTVAVIRAKKIEVTQPPEESMLY